MDKLKIMLMIIIICISLLFLRQVLYNNQNEINGFKLIKLNSTGRVSISNGVIFLQAVGTGFEPNLENVRSLNIINMDVGDYIIVSWESPEPQKVYKLSRFLLFPTPLDETHGTFVILQPFPDSAITPIFTKTRIGIGRQNTNTLRLGNGENIWVIYPVEDLPKSVSLSYKLSRIREDQYIVSYYMNSELLKSYTFDDANNSFVINIATKGGTDKRAVSEGYVKNVEFVKVG